jgi:hypothetical protein
MLIDDDIRKLLAQKSEGPHLDYKEGFAWTKVNRDKKYELVRDLIGMANTKDGGRVIVGVRDSDFEFVGAADDVFTSLDPNNIVQMIHENSAPRLTCEVIKRIIDGRQVIVFDVAEFDDTPIICTHTITSTEGRPRTILRTAAIYVRTLAATTEEVSSPDEMRSLLGRAIAKKGDELLHSIQLLITGKASPTSPDDRELYVMEVEKAHKSLAERLGRDLESQGHVQLISYPTTYAQRIATVSETRAIVEKSEVSLRGWNFPHTSRQDTSAFADGTESVTAWSRYREGYRIHRSGLFVWKRVFWEDVEEKRSESGKRLLSFVSLIWSFTEYLLFLARLYETVAADATIHIQITLYGCKDRELASFEPLVDLWPGKVSREDTIPQVQDVQVVELRAAHQDIAGRMAKHVFQVFNWDDVADETIKQWQAKLLKRRP